VRCFPYIPTRVVRRINVLINPTPPHPAHDIYMCTHDTHDTVLPAAPTALHPTEPTYLTNRAACHMALKFFRAALTDCQHAVSLQSSMGTTGGTGSSASGRVPAKTLIRLAKCHLALGSPGPALSALRSALEAAEGDAPGSGAAAAVQAAAAAREVERAARRMEVHLARFGAARAKGDWAMARLALEQARGECEGGGPVEWRCWRVELELARGTVEGAMTAAKWVISRGCVCRLADGVCWAARRSRWTKSRRMCCACGGW
jgi:hypothetical protein